MKGAAVSMILMFRFWCEIMMFVFLLSATTFRACFAERDFYFNFQVAVVSRKDALLSAKGNWAVTHFPFLAWIWRPSGKETTCQCRRLRDVGLIPGSGRSPGGGPGNSLQYSYLEKESQEQRSLAGYSSWCLRVGHDWATERACMHTCMSSRDLSRASCWWLCGKPFLQCGNWLSPRSWLVEPLSHTIFQMKPKCCWKPEGNLSNTLDGLHKDFF